MISSQRNAVRVVATKLELFAQVLSTILYDRSGFSQLICNMGPHRSGSNQPSVNPSEAFADKGLNGTAFGNRVEALRVARGAKQSSERLHVNPGGVPKIKGLETVPRLHGKEDRQLVPCRLVFRLAAHRPGGDTQPGPEHVPNVKGQSGKYQTISAAA